MLCLVLLCVIVDSAFLSVFQAWLHRLQPFAGEEALSVLKRLTTKAQELHQPVCVYCLCVCVCVCVFLSMQVTSTTCIYVSFPPCALVAGWLGKTRGEQGNAGCGKRPTTVSGIGSLTCNNRTVYSVRTDIFQHQ